MDLPLRIGPVARDVIMLLRASTDRKPIINRCFFGTKSALDQREDKVIRFIRIIAEITHFTSDNKPVD
jgi:hypothetical protein